MPLTIKYRLRSWGLLGLFASTACSGPEANSVLQQEVSIRGAIASRIGDSVQRVRGSGYLMLEDGDDVQLLAPDGTQLGIIHRYLSRKKANSPSNTEERSIEATYFPDRDEIWALVRDNGSNGWLYVDLRQHPIQPIRCSTAESLGDYIEVGAGAARGSAIYLDSRVAFALSVSARGGCDVETLEFPADVLDRELVDGALVVVEPCGPPVLHRWTHAEGWRQYFFPPEAQMLRGPFDWSKSGLVVWQTFEQRLWRLEFGDDVAKVSSILLTAPRSVPSDDGSRVLLIDLDGGTRVIDVTEFEETPIIAKSAMSADTLGSGIIYYHFDGRGIVFDHTDEHGDSRLRIARFDGTSFDAQIPPEYRVGRVTLFPHLEVPLLVVADWDAHNPFLNFLVFEIDEHSLQPGPPQRLREAHGIDKAHPFYLQETGDADLRHALAHLQTQNVQLEFSLSDFDLYTWYAHENGGKLWLSTNSREALRGGHEPHALEISPAKSIPRLPAQFGGHKFDLLAKQLLPIPLSAHGELFFEFNVPHRADTTPDVAHVELSVFDEHAEAIVATPKFSPGYPFLLQETSERVELMPDRLYTLRLVYSDSYGSTIVVERTNVMFEREIPTLGEWLIATPEGRAVLLWAGLLALAGIGAMGRHVLPKNVAAWSPAAVIALGSAVSGGSALSSLKPLFSIPVFFGLTGATVGIAVFAGLISHRTFRALSSIEPFRLMSPWLMSRARTRRRWFAGYVREMGERLHEEGDLKLSDPKAADLESSRKSYPESYIALPVRITEPKRVRLEVADPVEQIVAHLRAEKSGLGEDDVGSSDRRMATQSLRTTREGPESPGRVVFIEAPGGQGKSALKRAIIRRLLEDFNCQRAEQLPVLCGEPTDDINNDVCRALGRHAFNPIVVDYELRRGALIPVYEDLRSVNLVASRFNVVASSGRPLILVSRPFCDMQVELKHNSQLLLAEPQPLTRDTLGSFVEAYSQKPLTAERIDALADAFEGENGSYLPILIRLALCVDDDDQLTLTNVYKSIFRHLHKGKDDDEAFAKIRNIVVRECWEKGAFYLGFANATSEDKPFLEGLKEAGVLVPKQHRGDFEEPSWVGFFHDSMRSFIIASHLQLGQSDWDGIERAARDPDFSDTEIFAMAIAMGRDEQVGPELVSRLQRWFVSSGGAFAVTDILDAVPNEVGVERHNEGEISAWEALARALKALDVVELRAGTLVGRRDLDRRQSRHLATFFKRLAPRAEAALRGSTAEGGKETRKQA